MSSTLTTTPTFNFDLVRAFGIHSPGSTSSTSSLPNPPLFTSKPLQHPMTSIHSKTNPTLPTKYTLARTPALPISPPVPHRRAPAPPHHLPSRKHYHYRSNHLLSPLHEPERKGLWTVSEDDKGEQEAEWEERIRKTRSEAFERCLSRWTREDRVGGLDEFVDVDLYDHKTISSSTSCTSEEPSQCVTPSLDSDTHAEDVFFVVPTTHERSRGKRNSTCSFGDATSEEDEAGLFFAPTLTKRLDFFNPTIGRYGDHHREVEDCPSSPTSSEESFGSRLSPSRSPSNTANDISRRPPPLDLHNNLAWRSSLQASLPALGSPFTPSPAPKKTTCSGMTGLMSPIDLDPTTPKNAIIFSMTTPPPLSRSSRSSSLSSTASSSLDQPITPSPARGKTEDLLSATFADFLISAEEDPVPYIGVSPSTASKGDSGRHEINFPLPPFRLGSELPSTPSPRGRSYPLEPPGAPARLYQRQTIPPPSSTALQNAMGIKGGVSSTLRRGSSPSSDDIPTIRPRHAIPTSCGALQLATGLASSLPTSTKNRSAKSSSSSSTCSSSSSSSSTSSSTTFPTKSRTALPTRSPLPRDWIGYHPKENRI